jgi:hypothetical protein
MGLFSFGMFRTRRPPAPAEVPRVTPPSPPSPDASEADLAAYHAALRRQVRREIFGIVDPEDMEPEPGLLARFFRSRSTDDPETLAAARARREREEAEEREAEAKQHATHEAITDHLKRFGCIFPHDRWW